jgi:branched-chain amino acid transport system ATP-binding protein
LASADLALTFESVRAGYRARRVFEALDLSVARGEIVALLGHNGAGKTTAMRVAAGLTPAAAGRVTLDGVDVTRLSAAMRSRAGLSLVPQGVVGLFKTLTVRQNLDAARPGGDDGAAEQRLRESFGDVLVELGDRTAGSMSGGQQQILAISLALLRSPSVLLLDELSTGLAPAVVRRILALVSDLAASRGTTVVAAEQDIAAVLTVATRVCILQSGELVADFARAECPSPTELWRYF